MGTQPDLREPAMNAPADFDAFSEFLKDVETDFKDAARRHTENESAAHSLMYAAATRVASQWRTTDDPKRRLLDEVDHHAHTQWRDEEVFIHATPDLDRLAEAAWLAGRRIRRRRRRRWSLSTLVIVVLTSLYLWSAGVTPVDAENEDAYSSAVDTPSAVTVLDADTVALPPPSVLARTPFIQSSVPGDLDVVAYQAPPLEASRLDSIAMVFRADSYWPVVIAPDGLARSSDMSTVAEDPAQVRLWPRSISPDGERFAAGVKSTVVLVDRFGAVTVVPPPTNAGALLDIAWPPDGATVLASFETGTWLLGPGTEPVAVPWFGQATTFHPDTEQPVEFASTPASEIATRTWNGDEPSPPDSAEASAPIAAWHGAPAADTGRYVRSCTSSPEATVAGAPMPWCVAVLTHQTELEWLLLASERYAGVTILGARNGEIYLSVQSSSDLADQRILRWRLSDHNLAHVTTVTNGAQVAVGSW